ncbi:hypothetical protein ACIQMJ_30150, partial [Actinosynnema sp. NPDC091369]
HPDGTTTKAGNDGFAPGTHDTDKTDLDPTDARDRAARHDGPDWDEDYRDLRDRNRDLRREGIESFIANDPPPGSDRSRAMPENRALTTARYRSDNTGEAADFYSFSGHPGDLWWSPAAEGPQRPPREEQIFETSRATSNDPVTNRRSDGEGRNRVNDSEAKFFEDLTRHQLAEHSGLPRDEVDEVLREKLKPIHETSARDARAYPHERVYSEGTKGMAERTKDRVEAAIEELNRRAAARAEAEGRPYTPFTAADISGDLRMVVDLPSAREHGIPAQYTICKSCQKIILNYQRVFPNMRIDIVNLDGERLPV